MQIDISVYCRPRHPDHKTEEKHTYICFLLSISGFIFDEKICLEIFGVLSKNVFRGNHC